MAPELSEDLGDFTPTTQNEFLTSEFMPTHVATRCSSVPCSSRLCQDANLSMCDSKPFVADTDTLSTYESESDSGTGSLLSLEGLSSYPSPCVSPRQVTVYHQNSGSNDFTNEQTDSETCTSTLMSPPMPHVPLHEVNMYSQSRRFTPTPALEVEPPPQPHIQSRRLSANAAVFRPELHASGNQPGQKSIAEERPSPKAVAFQQNEVAQIHDMRHRQYRKNITEVIRLTTDLVKQSEHVRDVEVSEDGGSWSVIIQPKAIDENSLQTELLVTLARQALLDAATKSKSIYVLGYCAAEPFSMSVQGFQATLGVMQNAATACWHIFKKAFCRHGNTCYNQHPVAEVPVQFLVESVQLKPCAFFASVFKVQAANLALAVTAALGESPQVGYAEAFKDKDYQGWTIELTAKEDQAAEKDYLLTLAKKALFGATGDSDLLYIIGYSVKPFVQKSTGFVVFVGDMQDQSRVCWDMYSKGLCSRGGACRYQHPKCLMPINVVVKGMSHSLLSCGA